ncbi:LysR substrate-binding domain-containing protein [Thauera butanivorans]|uniref:LysR substrate-binding domain-containing protein n=1 Tax=Thauera butanivorans TaxID=86174 RepID=UPI003AB48530
MFIRSNSGRARLVATDTALRGHAGFPSWERWLRKMGVAGLAASRGLRINNSAAVLQAAIEGRGVALARSVTAHDDLASGRVLRLFPGVRFASELAYYVVYRPESAGMPKLWACRDWLLREAASGEQAFVGA